MFTKTSSTRARRAAFSVCGIFLTACSVHGPSTGDGATRDAYAQTFAGKNACNPKNAERPFIIDWDATDQSSFQAHAQSDVVFVRYHGCDLEVLEGCRDDSVKGSLGSYRSIQWTSGGLESIDIATDADLYAKLPLGVASLGARVGGGEKFHMEYFVSGTRTATRDHVFASELRKNPACEGATHFVYQYNLGAFALASTTKLESAVGGSYFGFGAGGGSSKQTDADKKGGVLSACSGTSAKEVDDCKVPIRLTLREISDGEPPEIAESKAPESDAALNLAGKLKAETDAQRKAEDHFDAAQEKLNARDGSGCLAELDLHDALDSRPKAQSASPRSAGYAMVRAQCLMLAGKCDAGKTLLRKSYELSMGASSDAQRIDTSTDAVAAAYCQGRRADRDVLIHARMELLGVAYGNQTVDAATCKNDIATIDTLRSKVKPRGDDDAMVQDFDRVVWQSGSKCLAKAGDCADAKAVYDARFVAVCQATQKANAEQYATMGMPSQRCAPMSALQSKVAFTQQIAPGTQCKAP